MDGTGFYLVVLGFTGKTEFLGFFWFLLGFKGFFQGFLIDFGGLY